MKSGRGRVTVRLWLLTAVHVLQSTACAGDDLSPAGPLPEDELAITTSTLPEGEEQVSYSATLESNRTAGVLWSLGQGDLPPGLQLSGSGEVSGIPERHGSWTFLVLAVDPVKADSVTKPLTIAIASAPEVLTTSLAKGVLGTPYLDTLAAAGGRAPFRWSIAEGALPPGLSLDSELGLITGTPTVAGIWELEVRVTTGVSSATAPLQLGVCATEAPETVWDHVEPWRTHHRDRRHASYVPVRLDACAFTLLWTLDAGGRELIDAQVVTEGGVVALTSNPLSRVITLDLETGGELWHVTGHSLVFGQPAIYGGTVFVHDGGHSSSRFRALDARSGSTLFEVPLENQLTAYVAPVVADDVAVSGGTLYGGLVGMSTTDGGRLWSHGTGTGEQGGWAPAIVDGSVVVVSGGRIRRLDLITGEVLGEVPAGCSCRGVTPTVTSAGSVVVYLDGRLASVDPGTDEIEWTIEQGPTILASDGEEIFGRKDANLEVIDLSVGTSVRTWVPPHGELAHGTTAVLTDNILFLSYSGQVHALDLESWTEVWHYPDAGSLSVSEGLLFIRSATTGVVSAIDLR